MDVTTLKHFRQAACTDPVAVQVLGLNRAKEGSSSAPRKPKFVPRTTNPAPKESYAAELAPKQGKGKPRNHPSGNRNHHDSTKLDQISSLPHKDGKLDMEQYSKYKDGGLRQKLHDAICAVAKGTRITSIVYFDNVRADSIGATVDFTCANRDIGIGSAG